MINRWCLRMLEFYKNKISPYRHKSCRYHPSCSTYSYACYLKFNFFKASLLTLARLLRCNPLFKGGYEYLPR
ncbi:MAG: membrane protein insertion efficiency factor YidD, partial [Acholeplasmatales bacterium]|nr:membrane protein insertion efficiency factor YidD [Acholeplasmatales bacterium]